MLGRRQGSDAAPPPAVRAACIGRCQRQADALCGRSGGVQSYLIILSAPVYSRHRRILWSAVHPPGQGARSRARRLRRRSPLSPPSPRGVRDGYVGAAPCDACCAQDTAPQGDACRARRAPALSRPTSCLRGACRCPNPSPNPKPNPDPNPNPNPNPNQARGQSLMDAQMGAASKALVALGLDSAEGGVNQRT